MNNFMSSATSSRVSMNAHSASAVDSKDFVQHFGDSLFKVIEPPPRLRKERGYFVCGRSHPSCPGNGIRLRFWGKFLLQSREGKAQIQVMVQRRGSISEIFCLTC
jgi:hypothetical protein